MSTSEKEFFKKLLATFEVEAEEHLKVISSGLLDLEKAQSQEMQDKIIEKIFREAHSLKGAARAVNLNNIEAICQSVETIFNALKRHEIPVTPDMLEAFHQALSYLTKLLEFSSSVKGMSGWTPSEDSQSTVDSKDSSKDKQLDVLHKTLTSFLNPDKKSPKKLQPKIKPTELTSAIDKPAQPSNQSVKKKQNQKYLIQEKTGAAETIRISAIKMDSLLLQVEELLSVKLAMGQRVADLQTLSTALHEWKKERAKFYNDVRILEREFKQSNIDKAKNGKKNGSVEKLLEYLNWNDTHFKTLERNLALLSKSAKLDHHSLSIMTENLLVEMKKALMLPLSSVLEIFPKMVRDLSRDQNKEVDLIINGSDIEIDKRILEEIKNPLIHMVRNCIDHGIERPEERKKRGKPPRGTIRFEIAQKNGSQFEIQVSDDGAGIDHKKVHASALMLKLISDEEAEKMEVEQIGSLIFQSGVSASSLITDISGRGLGLAIVREKVENLGGTVSVETQTDKGTTFRIILPLTIATFRGIFIRLDEQIFVVPTSYVEQVIRMKREEVKTVENRDTIQLRGKVVSLVKLHDVLGMMRTNNGGSEQNENLQIIVLSLADKKIAFLIDEILGEQEVLIKTLGKQLSRVKNISGVTLLGNGKVVPILNVFDVMKSSVQKTMPSAPVDSMKKDIIQRKSVLVAEDSITSRTLLKNILELEGYDVVTAIDGIDAFTQLRMKDFDVVVSDVDMPRMSGFDLTLKIRAEKKFVDLPVILVTALESREDRERGIEVGANAYIVKSSFDQSNLLEIIKRFV